MKKGFLFLMVLALLVAPLASLAELNAPGVMPVTTEPVTLRFLMRNISEGNGAVDMYTNNVTKLMEEKTGVHIEWEHLPATDADTKLNLIITSGDYPDVLFEYRRNQSTILEWSEEGIIVPLNELIEKHMPAYSQILNDREDIRIAVTAPDGNMYSFARTDGGLHILVNTKIFVYDDWRNQYFQATGKTDVVTTEDYREMLTFFRDNDMNGNGDATDEIPLSGTSGTMIQSLLNPFVYGEGMYLDNGKVTVNYNQDGYREGLRYIKSLWDEGLIDPEIFTQNASQISALVNKESTKERTIGGFCSLWDGSYVSAAVVPYETYKVVAPLEGPDGTRQTVYTKGDVGAGYGILFNTCEHPDVYTQWLDYLYTEEGTMLMAYGIEGTSWEWSDQPSLAGETRSVRRLAPGSTLYERNLQWMPTAPCYRTPEIKYVESAEAGGSGISLYNASIALMPYADPDKAIPRNMWETADQTEELALYTASIDEYVNEMAAKFITGAQSLDTDWDAYVAQLDAMGLAEYIAVLQDVLDSNAK